MRKSLDSSYKEFLQVNGEFAMRNLTVFIGVIVGSFVVTYLALMGKLTSEIFGIYIFATGGVYSFGKWQDDRTKRCQIDADSEPDIVPKNVTTINQPEKVSVSNPS